MLKLQTRSLIDELMNNNVPINIIAKSTGKSQSQIKKIQDNQSKVSSDNTLFKRPRIRKVYSKDFIYRLGNFISEDDNKGLNVASIKDKFEENPENADIRALNYTKKSYYPVITIRKHLNYSWKRISSYPIIQNHKLQSRNDTKLYAQTLINIILNNYLVVYIDETSINQNLRPNKAYAPRENGLGSIGLQKSQIIIPWH